MPEYRGRPSYRASGKPLNPSTEAAYRQVLLHCFGQAEPPFTLRADLGHVSKSRMTVIRSAIRWAHSKTDLDPEPIINALPELTWKPQSTVEIPTEDETKKIEAAAQRILPPGRRAAALLPLSMGLRAAEVLTLEREWVQRAYDVGELRVMRKGGKQQFLPSKHATLLFEELLLAPKASSLRGITQQMSEFRAMMADPTIDFSSFRWGANTHGLGQWKTVGEILSTGKSATQYQVLHSIIKRLGDESGIRNMRPHKLRHIFATRMIRNGAPLPVVQWMLGHTSGATTFKYIHPASEDAAKYL